MPKADVEVTKLLTASVQDGVKITMTANQIDGLQGSITHGTFLADI
jgi:hypothetical protein